MLIRKAEERDRPAIERLVIETYNGVTGYQLFERRYGRLGQETWQERKLKEVFASGSLDRFIVTEADDGTIVGFASYSSTKDGIGIVGNNGVHPNYRGRGIGTRQITKILELMREEGLAYAQVTTGLGPLYEGARRMYEKVGFERFWEAVTYYMPLTGADPAAESSSLTRGFGRGEKSALPISAERIWRHHSHLCRVIGPRLLGTEADHWTADYIEAHFRRCGLKVRRQEYSCPSWEHRMTVIRSASGFEIRPPEGGANMFSLPCDVKGESVVVLSAEEIETSDIRGKICIIAGDFTGPSLTPDRNELLLLIEEKAPLALILISGQTSTYDSKRVRDPAFRIPVCSVSSRAGDRLLKEGGEISVRIDARRFESSSFNVFGASPAIGEKRIRVIAHYDTAPDCPGAFDNASGIAVILEVAEALFLSGVTVPIEFIAFGGEEYGGKRGGLGAFEYLHKFQQEIDSTSFVINVDGVGAPGGSSRVYVTGDWEELNASVMKQTLKVGGYHEVKLGEGHLVSDHARFCERGIPAVFINDSNPWYIHTPLDLSRNISLERMEDAARIALGVILDMAPHLGRVEKGQAAEHA